MSQRKSLKRLLNTFELNENTNYQNLLAAPKEMHKEKFIALNPHVKK